MITKYMLKYMKLLNRFLFSVILIFGLGSIGFAEEEKLQLPNTQLNFILECLTLVIKNKELY